MKFYNIFAFIILNSFLISCDGSKNNKESFFSFDETGRKASYSADDALSLKIQNPQNKNIDSVIYYVNGNRVATNKDLKEVNFDLKGQKLGYQNVKAVVYFDGDIQSQEVVSRVEMVSNIHPKLLTYKIVNTYPHDPTSFTQGLEFYRDTLLESTGQHGTSYIRKLDYKTGKVHSQTDLEQKYFGEGITVFNNKVFQLTWQSGVGLIYNADNLKFEKTFNYDRKIEGWGLTNDGTYIYQSDGTEKVWKMDGATQKMIDYVNVYSAGSKIKSVNELEYVNGKIYGNIWQRDAIAVIDPASGAVVQVLDLKELRSKVTSERAEALNGIAYNKKTKTFFVTGKLWDKMFEIQINE